MNGTQAVEFYEKAADESGHLYFARYDISDGDNRPYFPHFHDSPEFILVREGTYLVHVGAQERLLHAGEIAFVDSFGISTARRAKPRYTPSSSIKTSFPSKRSPRACFRRFPPFPPKILP